MEDHKEGNQSEGSSEESALTPDEVRLGLDGRSVDWHLQELVGFANSGMLECGITLMVNGGILSGMLIGGRKYFELFAKDLTAGLSDELKEMLQKMYADKAEIVYPREDDDLPPPQYIHLAKAKWVLSSGTGPNNGILWRGRINAVSGFSLGLLGMDGEQD